MGGSSGGFELVYLLNAGTMCFKKRNSSSNRLIADFIGFMLAEIVHKPAERCVIPVFTIHIYYMRAIVSCDVFHISDGSFYAV